MTCTRALLAAVLLAPSAWGAGAVVQAPSYTTAGIVNAASYSGDALAPNTIASIFGTNLAFKTGIVSSSDFQNGGLPLTFANVTVYVGGLAAGLYFVSPKQINFLIPNILLPGSTTLAIVRDGVAGPTVPLILGAAGPGMFEYGSEIVATHVDGSLISDSSPAAPGEWIIIYCAGLGRTTPEAPTYALATSAAMIRAMSSFQVLINGTAVDSSDIYYAGLTPGYAGLYQVNLHLPGWTSANPEVRLAIGDAVSIPGTYLPVN